MMGCKHQWKILSETTTNSVAERAKKIGATFSGGNMAMFEQKLIQIVVCDDCGKLKRYVESI